MSGLLNINTSFGNQALGLQEGTEITDAERTLYNDQKTRENQAALMQAATSLASGAMKGGKDAYNKYKQGKQKAASDETQQNAAGAGPNGLGDGSSGTPGEQSSGMNFSQFAELFGTFFRGMQGSGGGE